MKNLKEQIQREITTREKAISHLESELKNLRATLKLVAPPAVQKKSKKRKAQRKGVTDQAWQFVSGKGTDVTAGDLVAALGVSRSHAHILLSEMAKKKQVLRKGPGLYALAENSAPSEQIKA